MNNLFYFICDFLNYLSHIVASLVQVVPKHNSQDEGFRFAKGTQNRSNQKQYHILLAGEKMKTAREICLIWLCPAGAVTVISIGQSKARLQCQE
jgi:hypothetical protein